MTIFENVFLSYESKGTGKFECKIKTEIKFLKITSRIVRIFNVGIKDLLRVVISQKVVKKL